MNTEPTPLQERIARAIYGAQEHTFFPADLDEAPKWLRESVLTDAAAVLPIIAAEARAAKAEAWHHGFQEGYCLEPRPDWANALSNPYRATEYETGDQA